MNSSSIIIRYFDQTYALNNLNDEEVNTLTNDYGSLQQYFSSCFETGKNISIVQESEVTDEEFACLEPGRINIVEESPPTDEELQTTDNISIDEEFLTMDEEFTTAAGTSSKIIQSIAPANVTCTMKQWKGVSSIQSNVTPANVTSTMKQSKGVKTKKNEKMSEDEKMLQDEILASRVMAQPMLFNPRLKSHRFSGMNAEKWKIIGEKIGAECPNADTSITKVKERWIKLRDDYLKRQRLKKRTTGSGRGDSDDEGPLDDLLSGLNDVYDQKEYVWILLSTES